MFDGDAFQLIDDENRPGLVVDIGESGDDSVLNKAHITYDRTKVRSLTVSENINVDNSTTRARDHPKLFFRDDLGNTRRSYQSYFYRMFPMQSLEDMERYINNNLTSKN